MKVKVIHIGITLLNLAAVLNMPSLKKNPPCIPNFKPTFTLLLQLQNTILVHYGEKTQPTNTQVSLSLSDSFNNKINKLLLIPLNNVQTIQQISSWLIENFATWVQRSCLSYVCVCVCVCVCVYVRARAHACVRALLWHSLKDKIIQFGLQL